MAHWWWPLLEQVRRSSRRWRRRRRPVRISPPPGPPHGDRWPDLVGDTWTLDSSGDGSPAGTRDETGLGVQFRLDPQGWWRGAVGNSFRSRLVDDPPGALVWSARSTAVGVAEPQLSTERALGRVLRSGCHVRLDVAADTLRMNGPDGAWLLWRRGSPGPSPSKVQAAGPGEA